MTEQAGLAVAKEEIEDRDRQLISTRRVEGTAVYSKQGDRLGTVRSIMLDKSSGEAAYAIMSFGGFLGLGALGHPLPWDMLTYSEERDGYVVDMTREQIEQAPTFDFDHEGRLRERSAEELFHAYHGELPWWGGRRFL